MAMLSKPLVVRDNVATLSAQLLAAQLLNVDVVALVVACGWQ